MSFRELNLQFQGLFYAALAIVCALVCLFSVPLNAGFFGLFTPLTVISAVLTFYFLHKFILE
jgi:hypothetical protein